MSGGATGERDSHGRTLVDAIGGQEKAGHPCVHQVNQEPLARRAVPDALGRVHVKAELPKEALDVVVGGDTRRGRRRVVVRGRLGAAKVVHIREDQVAKLPQVLHERP